MGRKWRKRSPPLFQAQSQTHSEEISPQRIQGKKKETPTMNPTKSVREEREITREGNFQEGNSRNM